MIEEGYYEIMDSETIGQDFDDIDLFATRMLENDDNEGDVVFEQVSAVFG